MQFMMILNHQLRQPIETVVAYLTDFQKYQSIHPLITKVEALPDGTYRIHERFLSSPLIFTYPATITSDVQDKTVEMKATIMQFIKVTMTFKFVGTIIGSSVIEEIDIRAPFPIRFLMEPIFRRAHTLLFKNLDALKNDRE